jgi:hypothetical protein
VPRAPTATVDYCVKSLVSESEPNLHVPFCCTYTSVTMESDWGAESREAPEAGLEPATR